jgi:4-amino-4-deoxy-L-arabinose transferase-like glycosyltransferase
VRLAYAIGWKWDQPLAVLDDQIGGDPGYYHYQANALAKGLWFVDPWSWALRDAGVHAGAEHPPLYTLFLSIPSALGFDTFRQHMLAGTILGSFTCGVVGFAGRAVGGRRVGIVAAFIAAVYANLWINDALVLSETITAFVVAFVVWFAYRFWREPTMRNAMLLGFTLGLATLARAELIFYFPIVALPLVIGARSLVTRERVRRGAAILLLAALPVLPWVIFNMVRFNNPVTLSTGGDFTFGNTYCDSTFYGERIGWWDLTRMDDRWQIEGDESDQALHFRREGLEYLADNLGRFPVAVAARVGRMWDVYAPFQKLHWDAFEMGRNPFNVARIALAQFYVLALLAIAGLVMLRRRRTIIYPLIGLAISVTIAAVLTFGGTRYRIPAEIAIVIAGAVPLAALLDRWFPPRGDAADTETHGGAAPPMGDADVRTPEPVAT